MDFTHWRDGDPNYHGPDGEHCAVLFSEPDYNWVDYICAGEVCAVCEIDIPDDL